MKTITLLLATIACSMSAVPAVAKTGHEQLTVTATQPDDPDTIRIPYGELNLTNAADKALLQTRVKQAARRTCGAVYDGAFLSQAWGCEAVVWNIAAPQISAAIKRAGTGQSLAGRAVMVRFAVR